MDKVNPIEKFSEINDYWNPRIAGELNGQHVKLVKISGEFVWHQHDQEDEMFLVIKGELKMHFREKTVVLNEGEFIIVPRTVDHKPEATGEAWIMLFEPAGTVNTGDVVNELTRTTLDSI